MKKKKVHEQVLEYSFEERNSVISGGNKFFLFIACFLVAFILYEISFVVLLIGDYIDLDIKVSMILLCLPLVIAVPTVLIWLKVKYPLYKEERYHYIKAIKKKMKFMNRPFDNNDMYKMTVSEFWQPMTWYGSLVLFLMFAWVVVCLGTGILFISGNIYGATSNMQATGELLYGHFGMGLKVLDIFIGIVNIGIAVLAVFAHIALNNFKKSALKLFISIYAIGFISNVIHTLCLCIIGVNILSIGTILPLIANAAVLAGNIIYFKKRSAWFVH